jgi:hypothetical protein
MDESCQSGSLHEIAISRVLVQAGSPTRAKLSVNCTIASGFLSLGVRLMKWASCGKIDLIEESYIHFVELRCVDADHEFL